MAITLPTTTLEAVNAMLLSIGEAPVNSVLSGQSDAAEALLVIQQVSRRLQMTGWSFNTDINFSLTPDINGYLNLPPNCLKVTTTGSDAGTLLVMRGSQLYDPINHTYVFTRAYSVNIVTCLEFEQLPENARQFVFLSAARKFQSGWLGSQELNAFTAADEKSAWAQFMSDESEVASYNIYTDDPGMLQAVYRGPGLYS